MNLDIGASGSIAYFVRMYWFLFFSSPCLPPICSAQAYNEAARREEQFHFAEVFDAYASLLVSKLNFQIQLQLRWVDFFSHINAIL